MKPLHIGLKTGYAAQSLTFGNSPADQLYDTIKIIAMIRLLNPPSFFAQIYSDIASAPHPARPFFLFTSARLRSDPSSMSLTSLVLN